MRQNIRYDQVYCDRANYLFQCYETFNDTIRRCAER